MSGNLKMHRSVFNRHRDAILDMFGIMIECKGHRYYIRNETVLKEDSVQNWLFSTLSVNNIISESMSLQHRIFLESIPQVRHLELLVEAMKENRKVVIDYQKYGSTEVSERVIEPYFLKLHKRRWYVMANTANGYRLFSFDRVMSAIVTKEKFKMPKDFDAKRYFEDCFGVMRDERHPAERIVLRALGNERHYMNDLPVHQSQKVIGEGEGYVDYEIFMRPTSDFIGYVMSRGSWLKVMSPQSLVDEIAENLRKTLGMYMDKLP
jgi:predicted DNA-binding transcriptional regulator YafY